MIELTDKDFERSSGSIQLYGPEFFVTLTDSILVTVQSRVGILGEY